LYNWINLIGIDYLITGLSNSFKISTHFHHYLVIDLGGARADGKKWFWVLSLSLLWDAVVKRLIRSRMQNMEETKELWAPKNTNEEK
jgi:hypothetical protein